jgi:hypothetical protein
MPLFMVNQHEGVTSAFVDGNTVATYLATPDSPSPQNRRRVALDPNKFAGPKLKIDRAKKHIQELEAAIRSFEETQPYALFADDDHRTRECVWSVALQKDIPRVFSSIIGDAIHNLRAAIDFAGCAMLQFQAQVGVQNMFIGPEGTICIGTPGPGCKPYFVPAGTPDTFKTVFPLKEKVEVHRTPPGFYENCQPAFFIAFGKSQIGQGKPVLIELAQLTDATERFLTLLERRAY